MTTEQLCDERVPIIGLNVPASIPCGGSLRHLNGRVEYLFCDKCREAMREEAAKLFHATIEDIVK